MTDTPLDLEELKRLAKESTPGPWNVCNKGDCSCKAIWCADNPIAEVTVGDWGDDYPSVRLVGSSLELKAEAYMEQITYGTIDEKVAKSNARYIVAAVNSLPALIAEVERLRALEARHSLPLPKPGVFILYPIGTGHD